MLLAVAVGGVVVIACVQVAQPLDSRALCHPLTTYLTLEVTVRPSYPSEGHSSDRLKSLRVDSSVTSGCSISATECTCWASRWARNHGGRRKIEKLVDQQQRSDTSKDDSQSPLVIKPKLHLFHITYGHGKVHKLMADHVDKKIRQVLQAGELEGFFCFLNRAGHGQLCQPAGGTIVAGHWR